MSDAHLERRSVWSDAVAQSSGEGGMRVSPCTSGISRPTSSTKHQDQISPGSSERISGWPLLSAWAVA